MRRVVLLAQCAALTIGTASGCGDGSPSATGQDGGPEGATGTGANSGTGGSKAIGASSGTGGTTGTQPGTGTSAGTGGTTGALATTGTGGTTGTTTTTDLVALGLTAGNPDGHCAVPAEAQPANTSTPAHVVGDGTATSCTADAFIQAVAAGGIITFRCGPDPVTITLDRPAKIRNDKGPDIVIDGGNLVTLSGGGRTRILYMNTCDEAQTWTTSHCQDQDTPRLTVQNLTFVDANSKNETEYDGGGAIWVRGGRLKVINSRFYRNVCADSGPDVGGAALRVFDQFNHLPVYVVNSTFGGQDGYGNVGSNGGAISSIGVSWNIINSLFSYNKAIGNGGNPAQSGTPGGGSGGAIYNDGNKMTLSICGTRIEHNQVVAYGSAIFFVSNDHTGNVVIDQSTITENAGGSWYPTYPQISNHDDTPITVTNSTIK